MNLIIWLLVGGLIGWVASIVMKTNGQQCIILNVVVGIVGAFLGGWVLAPLFGTGTIKQNDFSVAGLGVSAATAALDSVSHKVESVLSTLAPALNGVMGPLDKVVKFTREWPIAALLIAASSAALLSTLIWTGRHARNR